MNHYKLLGSLIYIEEKQGCYNTHSNRALFLPLSIEDKLISFAHRQNLDGHLFIAAMMSEIIERLKISTAKQIIAWLTRHCDIRLEPQEYAELISNLQQFLSTTTASHVVSSIEAVKGGYSSTSRMLTPTAISARSITMRITVMTWRPWLQNIT